MSTRITLNDNDPFEAALLRMLETSRKKRGDYATDNDPFWNFRRVAERTGLSPEKVILTEVYKKLARLEALEKNGKTDNPNNETVEDTYLDLATYATILFAFFIQKNKTDKAVAKHVRRTRSRKAPANVRELRPGKNNGSSGLESDREDIVE